MYIYQNFFDVLTYLFNKIIKTMEVIKISKKRIEQLLPDNIKQSDVISNDAKKVLAVLINYFVTLDVAKKEGYVVLPNSIFLSAVEFKKNNHRLLTALQELIETNLIKRERGEKWKAGNKAKASKYFINFENLEKPLELPDLKGLLKDFCTIVSVPVIDNVNVNVSSSVIDSVPVSVPVPVNDNVSVSPSVNDSVLSSSSVIDSVNEIESVIVSPSLKSSLVKKSSFKQSFNPIKEIKLKELEKEELKQLRLKREAEEGFKEYFKLLKQQKNLTNGKTYQN